MRIAEIYRSVQGEGLLTGTDSVFVRASGCNLRCCFCDTPHTSWNPIGDDLAVDEIVAEVLAPKVRHVVITGGEPLLFTELVPICDQLRQAARHITIETAGTLFLRVACDLMSISPKMSNSAPNPTEYPKWHARHERVRAAPDVIEQLLDEYRCQFKFVMSHTRDLVEVEEFLTAHPRITPELTYLMPEGIVQEQLAAIALWLQPLCQQRGFQFCPRKQIEWFGYQPRT